MRTLHSLPKRRGLAVAVQLALTFAAGMYAPRIRAQQIACPASGVTVTAATETNGIGPCIVTGALTVDSGGTLNNTGALRTSLTIAGPFSPFVGNGTISNSGTLNNNGLGELTIDHQGVLDNNSGGILNNNGAGIPGTDRGLTVRGTLRNNSGGLLNNNGKLRIGGTTSVTYDLFRTRSGDFSGTIENSGTLTNSSIMDLYFSSSIDNNAGGILNNSNSAFLTLRDSARINNNSGGTVTNNGSLRFFNYSVLRNNSGAVFNNDGTLELDNLAELYSSGTLNNNRNGTLTIRDRGELTSRNLVNSGSLVNRSSGAFPNPTEGGLNNSGTMTNAGSLVNYGKLVNVFGTITNDWFLTNLGTLYNRRVSTLNNSAYLDNYAGATFDNYGDLNNSLGARLGNSGTLLNYNSPGRAFTNHGRFYNNAGGLLINRGVLNNTGLLYNSSGYMGPGGTIENSGTLDNTGLIQNNGALTNSGTLTSGALTIDAYGGRTGGLVNQGTLANTGTLTTEGLLNYGTLSTSGALTSNGDVFNHGTLSNAGTVTITNTHALTNYGTFSNLAGGVIDNNGYLVNYSTLTNAGTLNNNLVGIYSGLYNRGQLTSSGTFNNASRLYNLAGATLANSGTLNNTYLIANDHGSTLSNSGTLDNAGLLFNSSAAYLNNSGTLINSDTLSNFGTVTNSGTLINNGSLFSNGAIVNSGTFVVASPVDGPLGTFSQSAGVLQGNSSMTQAMVTINGGRLMPGAPGAPGTLTINGSLVLGAGAVLAINATPAQTSRVTVNGAANVAGTVELSAAAGTYPETRQTILSATGGVTGTFSGVTSASAFLTPSLSYDPNTVFLSFYRSATFDSVAMTPNQAAVSTLLGAIGGGGDADVQAAIGTLSGLSAHEARAAYDSLGGAASTSAAFKAQFSMVDGFLRTLGNRLAGAGSGGLTAMLPIQVASAGGQLNLFPAAPERNGAWVLAYGNHGKTDGDANAAGYKQEGGGVAFGADTAVGERWRAGAAVNIGTQRAKLDSDGGKVTVQGASVAVYARYSAGALEIDGMAGIGRNGNESLRTVNVGGIPRTARADYDSNQQFAQVEAAMKGWRVEPVAGLGYTTVDSPGYTETGAGGLSLQVEGQARESIKSHVGARSVFVIGSSLKLTGRALWTHEFGDADSALATARFSGAPATGTFQTRGVDLKRDGALLGVALSGDWRRNLSLFGDVSIEARQGQWNAAAFAGMRYAW